MCCCHSGPLIAVVPSVTSLHDSSVVSAGVGKCLYATSVSKPSSVASLHGSFVAPEVSAVVGTAWNGDSACVDYESHPAGSPLSSERGLRQVGTFIANVSFARCWVQLLDVWASRDEMFCMFLHVLHECMCAACFAVALPLFLSLLCFWMEWLR